MSERAMEQCRRTGRPRYSCDCEECREWQRDLEREANAEMMPELPDFLLDEPWGDR